MEGSFTEEKVKRPWKSPCGRRHGVMQPSETHQLGPQQPRDQGSGATSIFQRGWAWLEPQDPSKFRSCRVRPGWTHGLRRTQSTGLRMHLHTLNRLRQPAVWLGKKDGLAGLNLLSIKWEDGGKTACHPRPMSTFLLNSLRQWAWWDRKQRTAWKNTLKKRNKSHTLRKWDLRMVCPRPRCLREKNLIL